MHRPWYGVQFQCSEEPATCHSVSGQLAENYLDEVAWFGGDAGHSGHSPELGL